MTERKMVLEGERPKSWNEYYSGKHWSVRNREAKRVHTLVRSMIDPDDRPFDAPVAVTFTVYYDKNPQDSTNILDKLYEDGMLAKGGFSDGYRSWLWDDDPEHVVSTTTIPRVDKDNPRVEIILRTVD